jgi:hypothetical protein
LKGCERRVLERMFGFTRKETDIKEGEEKDVRRNLIICNFCHIISDLKSRKMKKNFLVS